MAEAGCCHSAAMESTPPESQRNGNLNISDVCEYLSRRGTLRVADGRGTWGVGGAGGARVIYRVGGATVSSVKLVEVWESGPEL